MPYETISQVDPSAFPEEWYDSATEDHFWMQWRFRALMGLLAHCGANVAAPLKGLDIGCGAGVLQAQIEAATIWTLDGADVNRAALTQNTGGRGRVLLYDIRERRPELAGSYDFITMFDVIEHIAEPVPFIEAAAAHLKPGGMAFINVPALQALYSPYDDAAGHFRRYNRRALARELGAAGFEVTNLRYWGGSLLPILALRSLMLRFVRQDRDIIRLGFAPPSAAIHARLVALMRTEMAIAPRPWLGTSLLASALKHP
jgi:SAM-dependent methyltransferase